MTVSSKLEQLLFQIDGRSYASYKALAETWCCDHYQVIVDHVQGDPFASPSRVRVQVKASHAKFPDELWSSPDRKRALCDYLARQVEAAIGEVCHGRRGMGKSGQIALCELTQQVLHRNAIDISTEGVGVRLTMGLPARGRTILGAQALAMFGVDFAAIIEKALVYDNLDQTALTAHIDSVCDQVALRNWLDSHDAVAFIADGANLPRTSGIDEHPLADGLPFEAPEALAVTVDLPHAGAVRGLAIPRGVTLIVGGGFHGKSTLLRALEMGVYDHIPADGRAQVVADPSAVKVRAEDGRAVSGINISPFIDNLPFGRDTTNFSTDNASGSTSQAAGIVEALASGCKLLLIDEDTSATNFMIRDARMQQLVAPDKEPITPFLHRVRSLYDDFGVSTVLVVGGSGDYFEVADTVLMLDAYRVQDVTEQAHTLAKPHQLKATPAPDWAIVVNAERSITPPSALTGHTTGKPKPKIDVRDRHQLRIGNHRLDLSLVPQLADAGQLRAIGQLLHCWNVAGDSSMEALHQLWQGVEASEDGLDTLIKWPVGNLSRPRWQEVMAVLNRLRPPEEEVEEKANGSNYRKSNKPSRRGRKNR